MAATDLGTSVLDDLKGSAAGILNTSAQLGTALGAAALLLLMTQLGPGSAWAAAAAMAGLVAVVAFRRVPHTLAEPGGGERPGRASTIQGEAHD